jgi:predicted nucleotidyltransferase
MKKRIKDGMRKLGVSIIYLFGSRAAGRGSPLSDIDIGVVLKNPSIGGDTRALYNKLYGLLSDQYPESRLALVFLQRASLAPQFLAVRGGTILFEEDSRYTADYEKRVIQEYLDFRPVLDLFDSVAAESYARASKDGRKGQLI